MAEEEERGGGGWREGGEGRAEEEEDEEENGQAWDAGSSLRAELCVPKQQRGWGAIANVNPNGKSWQKPAMAETCERRYGWPSAGCQDSNRVGAELRGNALALYGTPSDS